ncbi:MAG: hypothetical protein ACHQF0_12925 [Chitinophagales bacterium]
MKIDRHNYEEYFLLYIDNELTVEQKKQVDEFVKENPDLEEEFLMLQQSKLVPDHSVVFDKKDALMRNENDSFINLNNYEEWLVLYVDDELTEEEKGAVEKFAAAHPQVHQEFEIFQQTRLQPVKIVFANKEVLYRKERVGVISMQWWRVAVAAILIIAAGITLFSVLRKENIKRTPGEIAGNKGRQSPDSVKSVTMNKQEQNTAVVTNEQQLPVTTPIHKKANKENKETKQRKNVQETQENIQQLANNLPVNNETEKVQTIASEVTEKTSHSQMSDAVAVSDKMHKENFNTPAVTNSSLQTPDNSNTSDNGVQYASNTENKKFRGFFRKATRFIERTTNINPANDDNKVLIGGMAINLK